MKIIVSFVCRNKNGYNKGISSEKVDDLITIGKPAYVGTCEQVHTDLPVDILRELCTSHIKNINNGIDAKNKID